MKRALALGAALAFAASCGGRVDGSDAGHNEGGSESSTGQCCAPSGAPNCCMSYGGWSDHGCAVVCDGMPTPSTPGWHQEADSHGCAAWVEPPGATALCGEAPPDAGPPPPCPAPADVSGFVSFVVPARHDGTACTSPQISDFYAQCYSSTGSPTKCAAAQSSAPACAACMFSSFGDSTWGAVVDDGNGIVSLDTGGCLMNVLGDAAPTSCGAKQEAVEECEHAACAAQCPVTDMLTFQDYQTCVTSAIAGPCASYVSAACVTDGGAAAACDITTFESGFLAYGAIFCGGS